MKETETINKNKKGSKMKKMVFALAAAALVAGAAAVAAEEIKKAEAAPAQQAAPVATVDSALAFLPDVLATVNGREIKKSEVADILKSQEVSPEMLNQVPKHQLKLYVKQIIDGIVMRDVMKNVVANAGFMVDEKKALEEMDKMFKSMPKEQQDTILARLKSINKTYEDYCKEVAAVPEARASLSMALFKKSVDEKYEKGVTDADAEKFYRENQDKFFKKPELITVSHILVLVPDDKENADAEAKAKIESIQARLAQGEKFETLAASESACPSGKANGGKLDAFTPDGKTLEGAAYDSDFVKASLALAKPGDVSAPVKTVFGYHLIRLESREVASYIPFDKVKADIVKFIVDQKSMAEIEKLAQEEKAKMKVVYLIPEDAPAAMAPAAAPAPAPAAPAK